VTSSQLNTGPVAGRRIRVLIVDDSMFIRNIVGRIFREEPAIEVVGTAVDGLDAIGKVGELKPDVVTLDVEMPRMTGLEAIKKIRAAWPPVKIVMLSTLTESGARVTIDALLNGANDYVSKTNPDGSNELPIPRLKHDLIAKVRQFFPGRAAAPPTLVPNARPAPVLFVPAPTLRAMKRRRVVAIGVSTGGPSALSDVIPSLPANLPVPVLIVQHMPAMFTRILAERLNAVCPLNVREAADNMPVEPGSVLIAPGDYHMRVTRRGGRECIALDQAAPENSCRPAVDVMFRSVNEVYGGASVAVILTGMGQDGYHAAQTLKASGAYVIAQNEASSVVWGMPGMVARAGLADAVVDLKLVASEIIRQF
jgi:two-component system, chemotaxis family, protein-glutamate methylesterase/glutaminase